ncbi:MAG: hypothetical protein ACREBF_02450 [Candidatus Micrarchaeales archaeon]
MKVLANNAQTMLIASDDGGKCPRAIISKNTTKFADDYYGRLRTGKSMLTKFIGL